jgi:hypothetical protein
MAARPRKRASPPPLAGNPTFAELIREAIDSRLLDVHTALPGRILTYDKATQIATVELLVLHPAPVSDGTVLLETYAVLPSVPVAWPRGGGYSLQFPLRKGDTGLVIFSEAADGNWRVSGDLSEPGDLRRHDLSYGKFYPGIGPDTQPLDPPVTDDEARIDGPTLIRLGGASADFVARAAKVDAGLSDIASFLGAVKATLTGGIGVAGSAGTFTVPFSATPPTPASTAAAKVKAE